MGLDSDLWFVRSIVFLRGCCIAFNMVSMQTALFSAVPRERIGRASSLFNTSRQVAVAFGVAVAASVLISQLPGSTGAAGGLSGVAPPTGLAAFHAAIAVQLGFAALAVFFATQVRDRPPAAAQRQLAVELEPVGGRVAAD